MPWYVNTTYEIFLFYIQRIFFVCLNGQRRNVDTCIIIFFSTAAAGLAVGLSVFFFILFCVVIPIAICVLIYCCVAGPLQHALGGSTVVRTTVNTQAQVPAAGVVTTRAMVCVSSYISHLISVIFPFGFITQ